MTINCDTVDGQHAASGTYTPTLTNITNVDASTPYVCQYMRVGNVVTVSGSINIDPTATGLFQVDLTLPIASNFADSRGCRGICASEDYADVGEVFTDPAVDKARIRGRASNATVCDWSFIYVYLIV